MILTGWKEIAGYLHRGVRTVQRWEPMGLPVRRMNRSKRSPVVADSEELDVWILSRFAPKRARSELQTQIKRARKLRGELEQTKAIFTRTMETLKRQFAELAESDSSRDD